MVTDLEKDLGVSFDKCLNFDLHIDDCINRANKMMGIINRSFVYLDKVMFLSLFKSRVWSIVEYGNCIWSLLYNNLQRKATKMVQEIDFVTYEERLEFLHLLFLDIEDYAGILYSFIT